VIYFALPVTLDQPESIQEAAGSNMDRNTGRPEVFHDFRTNAEIDSQRRQEYFRS